MDFSMCAPSTVDLHFPVLSVVPELWVGLILASDLLILSPSLITARLCLITPH